MSTTNNRPMSLLSIECVMQYMDANARFQIHQQCPSLKSIEKKIPLSFEMLHVEPSKIRINGTTYQFGIIQHIPNGEVSEHIKWSNNRGGMAEDVDEYGLPIDNEEIEKTSDEVVIDTRVPDEESHEWRKTHRIWIMEHYRKKGKFPPGGPKTIEDLDRKIKRTRDYVQIFDLRRDKVSPLGVNFLQLTIQSPRDRKVEIVSYHKRIHEAMKFFMEKLFGGRRGVIKINTLKVNCENGLIRFPLLMNFKIRKLGIMDHAIEVLNSLEPLLDSESFPLESIEINSFQEITIFEDPRIQTAHRLVLNKCHIYELPLLRHPRVHLANCMEFNWTVNGLLSDWLTTGREIGTCYSFRVLKLAKAQEVMKLISLEPNARVISTRPNQFPTAVIFQMDEFSELKISCKKDPKNKKMRNLVFQVQSA